MDELISKEMARRIIDSPRNKEQMLRTLESIPPAKPKKGKWIDKFEETREALSYCNLCGYPVSYFYKTSFCPHCGAKMEGEDE